MQGGFGSADLAKAEAFKQNFEQKERLAELHAKELQQLLQYRNDLRDRLESTSSESSNYDTPPGSPGNQTKTKGKLRKNLDQVTNRLGFSFASSRITRASVRKKEGTGWPPKS